MIVDFQHHYHPRSLHESALSKSLAINKTGKVPTYFAPDALFDLDEHIRVMDLCGIDAAVLSSGLGMDGAPLELCRHVNGAMHDAVRRFPKRFFGLAHVPPLGGTESFDELARCAVELGFPGVVVTSEVEACRWMRRNSTRTGRNARSAIYMCSSIPPCGRRPLRICMPMTWSGPSAGSSRSPRLWSD